jgi:hypothetical protein
MPSLALAALLAAQASPPASTPQFVADPAPASIAPLPPPAAGCCLLRALTPLLLRIDEPVESDKAAAGQYFKLSLREPLRVSDQLIIPAGTTGSGQVVHAAKSRAMGKAGELVLAARFLDFQGQRIPLRSLRYGSGQGKDNIDTAAIVGIAVSAVITPFITGGEVRVPAGADVWAKVAADVAFPSPAPPAEISPPPSTTGVE